MKRSALLVFTCALALLHAQKETPYGAAEKARDSGDVTKLQAMLETARQAAAKESTFTTQHRIALLDFYLLEAIFVQGKNDLIKDAATEGFAAAEKAAVLDSTSSEAHRLESDLAVMLIPYSTNGAVNYGKRTAAEADKALELDPNNAKAWVSRGLSYFYAPVAAGGDKVKGIELLIKAGAMDPTFDVPHIFLAQMYLTTGKKDDALREINEALRLNPDRRTAQMTYKSVTAAAAQ
jgi:tetratricopeptide (TPR) repeat protein